MNNYNEKVINVILNEMDDECKDRVCVILNIGARTTGLVFDINDSKTKCNYNLSNGVFNALFSDEDFDNYFLESGIYVYRFSNKKLSDYHFIQHNGEIIINGNFDDICYIVLNKLYDLVPINEKDGNRLKDNLQIENIFNEENSNLNRTNIFYNNVEIIISANILESKKHVYDDYKLLDNNQVEKLIREKFIPWLKESMKEDYNDDMIFNGLKVYAIAYKYFDDYSKFVFSFEGNTDYVNNLLQAADMEIIIKNGEISKINCYDV